MARPRLKAAAAVERLRESLWLIPGLMVAAAAGLAALLATKEAPAPNLPLRGLLLPVSAEAAVPVLQVVGASVITVTSVVFSLTVVALQITAGNYSPRALRSFLRDLGTQIVLGTFLATFVYSYLVLQNIQSASGRGGADWAPQLAFLAVPGFVSASLIAFVFFIHHVTQAVRVDFILDEVLDENLATVRTVHREQAGPENEEKARDVIPDGAVEVKSPKSGFVQSFGPQSLLRLLEERDLVVAFRPSVGDHVLEGAAVAWMWQRSGSAEGDETVADAVRDSVQIGRERSMDQDVAFGIRQLVDIAVRALSPGVNDPNTAVSTIHHLTVVYRELLTRRLGSRTVTDDDGVDRVMLPYATLREYLAIMVQQVGHYGRGDVMVVLRLLRALGELKSLAPPHHHEALDVSIDEVLHEAEQGLDVASDLQRARDAATDAKEQTFGFRDYTAAG
ncbi:MAG: DUF2254 domain-containing protein [Actinomycetota bacterium]|nr:DUF2254 domain-containing protein [Actinomycetota bacterium]